MISDLVRFVHVDLELASSAALQRGENMKVLELGRMLKERE